MLSWGSGFERKIRSYTSDARYTINKRPIRMKDGTAYVGILQDSGVENNVIDSRQISQNNQFVIEFPARDFAVVMNQNLRATVLRRDILYIAPL